jgi:protein-disulfide isomerase
MQADQKSPTDFASGKRRRNRLYLSAAVIGLLILGALIVLPRLNSKSVAAPINMAIPTPTDAAPLDAAPSLGPKTAPIAIIEYGDFGCPSCWLWHKQGVLNELRAKYGDQIHFVWRDFPVITLLSPKAAEAGQCAHEQGKFWEFHDLVYERDGAIEASNLEAYAAEIGLDMAQFNDCVTSRRYQDRVNAEQTLGFQFGYVGAPWFIVNGGRLIGLQRLPAFAALIDPLLASKK